MVDRQNLARAKRPPACPRAAALLETLQAHPNDGTPAKAAKLKPLVFPVSPRTRAFYRAFFPGTTAVEWNDWRWQSRARIRSLEQAERIFTLSVDERAALVANHGELPLGITPYYASLFNRTDPLDGLRRTHIPVRQELVCTPGEATDPLGEDADTPVPGLVHRYPDRVLFLATGTCGTYCRYCTRSRAVGKPGGEYQLGIPQWERALDYIAAHREVRDVLVSGGDPLTLSDDKLDYLLGRLKAIRHLELIRIGTKAPVVLPMRVTRALVKVLRKHKPLWMSLHVTHPDELTPEVDEAMCRLADAGVPLGSQTVLLRGVNDDLPVMKRLMHGLVARRCRPYYLYQLDRITGSEHFRTRVAKGLELIAGLRGHTTGYAVPTYVIDAPSGGGKIPLLPNSVIGRNGDDLLLRNFEGGVFRYRDEPVEEIGAVHCPDPIKEG